MVGLSHVAFRELVRSYTPPNVSPLLFTEMLSTRRLPSEKLDVTNELKIADAESHFVPQLLGNEERFIAPSIEKLSSKNPWGFDINMGCPTSHVLKHNWGVRLMGDRKYAAEVVAITKKHSKVPVSVKLRGSGNDSTDEGFLFDFTSALEDAGADWLTIHARTAAQKHEGKADWQIVGNVREKRTIPVVANGDVQTSTDAISVLKDFNVDGVMIGRAAMARPWILWQIAADLGLPGYPEGREGELPPRTPEQEAAEYFRACLLMVDLVEKYFGDTEYSLTKFQFFAAMGCRWFAFGHSFWKTSMKAKSLKQLRELVLEYASKGEHTMNHRISL